MAAFQRTGIPLTAFAAPIAGDPAPAPAWYRRIRRSRRGRQR